MVMTWSAMTQSALCTVCTGHEHRTSIQRSEEGGRQWYRHTEMTLHLWSLPGSSPGGSREFEAGTA